MHDSLSDRSLDGDDSAPIDAGASARLGTYRQACASCGILTRWERLRLIFGLLAGSVGFLHDRWLPRSLPCECQRLPKAAFRSPEPDARSERHRQGPGRRTTKRGSTAARVEDVDLRLRTCCRRRASAPARPGLVLPRCVGSQRGPHMDVVEDGCFTIRNARYVAAVACETGRQKCSS